MAGEGPRVDLEKLGKEAFVGRGSPLTRWEQITQEERRAWMQGAAHGYESGKAEGAYADEAVALLGMIMEGIHRGDVQMFTPDAWNQRLNKWDGERTRRMPVSAQPGVMELRRLGYSREGE